MGSSKGFYLLGVVTDLTWNEGLWEVWDHSQVTDFGRGWGVVNNGAIN